MQIKHWFSCCILVLLAPVVSAEGILWLEADTGRADIAYRGIELSAIVKYELAEVLGEGWEQRISLLPFYRVNTPDGFAAVRGVATVHKAGKLQKIRFFTVASRDAFLSFVDDVAGKRGSGVSVNGTEDDKVISMPESQKSEDGKFTNQWEDTRIRYSEGIIAMGEPSALDGVDLNEIKTVAEQAKGKYWYYYFDPDSADVGYWKEIVKNALRATASSLQQFDNESAEQYKIRRNGLEAKLALINFLMTDTEQFSAWTEWPASKDESFRFGMRLVAKDNSSMQRFLGELQPGAALPSAKQSPPAMAALRINMAFPELLAQWILMESTAIENESLRGLVTRFVSDRKISMSAGLESDSTGMLQVSGVAGQLSEQFFENIAGRAISNELTFTQPIVPSTEWAGIPLKMAILNRTDSELHFAISDSSTRRSEQSFNDATVLPLDRHELVHLSIDAKVNPNINDASRSVQFWTNAEQLYDWWITKPIRDQIGVSIDGSYTSFVPRRTETGDWTAEVSAKAYGDVLAVEGRVGNALHEMCVARRIAAQRYLTDRVMRR